MISIFVRKKAAFQSFDEYFLSLCQNVSTTTFLSGVADLAGTKDFFGTVDLRGRPLLLLIPVGMAGTTGLAGRPLFYVILVEIFVVFTCRIAG